MHVSRVGTEELSPTAEVTVTVTKADGTTKSETVAIGFYLRSAKVGDYVYADGSYSDIFEVQKGLVGICFYVNPENKDERLCMAVQTFKCLTWGILQDSLNGIVLKNYPTYSVYDIPTLPNKGYGLSAPITEDNYRDDSGTGDPDGYKIFPENTCLSEIGFRTIDDKISVYEAGTRLPYGKINTLRILEHRNKILSDPNVNLTIPNSYIGLINTMNELIAMNGGNSAYSQYYYSAASMCNLWTPTVPVHLSDKFKSGQWFLGSLGEMARIAWLYAQGQFDKLINILISDINGNYATSNEISLKETAIIKYNNVSKQIAFTLYDVHTKSWSLNVIPITTF